MDNMFLVFCTVWLVLQANVFADPTQEHEPHLHSEVKIVGYEGPLNKHMMSLFRNAETFKFIDCNITHVPSHLYSRMPKLKKLYVERIYATNVDYDNVMQDAPVLEEFYFFDNYLEKIHTECLRTLHYLKICKIRHMKNPHGKLKANSFNETKLEHFEFSHSHITDIDDLAFNGLEKLKTLNLTGNDIKEISKETLAPLTNLKVLDLSDNKLEEFNAENLPQLPKLTTINISSNPLKELDLDTINAVAPNLKTVIITDTPIPEDKLKEIAEKTKIDIISKN